MPVPSGSRRLPEIEYLRAVAVLAVVFNHLKLAPGGFAGVDMFFVISGFVISQALYESDRSNVLTCLRHFYYRRIIRILPPLLVVTMASFVLGWWLYYDLDLVRLQEAIAAQSLFFQNAHFVAAVADYFRGISSTQLTLHTWSLAVEEQFYIVFPLFFILLFNARLFASRMASGIVLGLATAAAAYLAIWNDALLQRTTAVLHQPFAGGDFEPGALRFYAMTFRAWEFLLGCTAFIASLHGRDRPAVPRPLLRLVFSAGLAMLTASALLQLDEASWPNGWTVGLCVVCAVSLIAAGLRHDERAHGLAGVTLAYVGNTSYSAYLWHWPLLGYLSYTNFDFGAAPTDYVIYFTALAGLVAATYHTIEKQRFRISPAASVVVLIGFVLGTAALGAVDRDERWFTKEKQQILSSASYDVSECKSSLEKITGRFVVLFGESHAQMVRAAIKRAAASRGYDVLCIDGSRARLGTTQDEAVQDLRRALGSEDFAGLLMVMRWNMYSVGFPPYEVEESGNRFLPWEGTRARNAEQGLQFFKLNLERLIRALGDAAPVGILLQVPQMPFFAHKEALIDFHGLRFRPLPRKSSAEHQASNAPVRDVFEAIAARQPGVSILDPAPLLCVDGVCQYRHGWDVLYKDDDHLSVYGASLLEPLFAKWLEAR